MIRIKYGPNPQGIREVKIHPQLVDSLVKKNKENKKRPEPKKNNPKKKEETPKVVLTPPRRKRCGNKNKTLQSPPPHHQKPTKWCGNQRRCNLLSLLPQARMYHPQARNEGRGVLLIGL